MSSASSSSNGKFGRFRRRLFHPQLFFGIILVGVGVFFFFFPPFSLAPAGSQQPLTRLSSSIALTAIGLTLLAISLMFVAAGTILTKSETTSVFPDMVANFDASTPLSGSTTIIKTFNFTFYVRRKSNCIVQVTPDSTSAGFSWSLAELPPTVPPEPGSHWEFAPKVPARHWPSNPDLKAESEVETGHYHFQLRATKGKVNATVNITLSSLIKPLEKWVEVGLRLLPVSIPILVTGIVAILFGS